MKPDKINHPRLSKIEKKKPDNYLDNETDEELTEIQKTRSKFGRMIIEILRRRLYESKEKYKLRKKLREQRKKLRQNQVNDNYR